MIIDPSAYFQIPNEIVSSELFGSSKLKADAFFCGMSDFINSFVLKLNCLFCRDELIVETPISSNALKRHRNDFSSELSAAAAQWCLKMEYAFKMLADTSSSPNIDNFLQILLPQISKLHCEPNSTSFAREFFKIRLQIMKKREIHKSNKFASKSLK